MRPSHPDYIELYVPDDADLVQRSEALVEGLEYVRLVMDGFYGAGGGHGDS